MEESCRNTRQFPDEESFPIDLISTVTASAIRLEDYENLKDPLNKEPQLLTNVKHSLELLGFKVLPLLNSDLQQGNPRTTEKINYEALRKQLLENYTIRKLEVQSLRDALQYYKARFEEVISSMTHSHELHKWVVQDLTDQFLQQIKQLKIQNSH